MASRNALRSLPSWLSPERGRPDHCRSPPLPSLGSQSAAKVQGRQVEHALLAPRSHHPRLPPPPPPPSPPPPPTRSPTFQRAAKSACERSQRELLCIRKQGRIFAKSAQKNKVVIFCITFIYGEVFEKNEKKRRVYRRNSRRTPGKSS